MKPGKILLVLFGTFSFLIGIAFLVGSGWLFWLNSVIRDDEGFFTTDARRFESPTHAIVSEDIDITTDIPDEVDFFLPNRFLDVRFTVTPNESKAIFIGIAEDQDVRRYLSGISYDEVTNIRFDPFRIEYRDHPGDALLIPPTSQNFWEATVEGRGTQILEWEVESGIWSIVIMNADGSAGVDVDLSAGAKVPFIFGISIGLLAGGLFLVFLGGFLFYLGARRQVRA